jgi:hypothetical protein
LNKNQNVDYLEKNIYIKNDGNIIKFIINHSDSNLFTKEILQSEDNDVISNLNELETDLHKFYTMVFIKYLN